MRRLLSPVKELAREVLTSPTLAPVGNLFAGLCRVLLYHRVVAVPPPDRNFIPHSGLIVDVGEFEKQIEFFSKNYLCLDLPTAAKQLAAGTLPERSVVITFDDGYRDNLTLALPVLKRYNVPATIYVTTNFIERRAELWWYEQAQIVARERELKFSWRGTDYHFPLGTYAQKLSALDTLNKIAKLLDPAAQDEFMNFVRGRAVPYDYDALLLNWDEVRALDSEPLITIGAHTVNHPVLYALPENDLHYELTESKKIMEEKLGHAVEHFAYPFGGNGQAGPREFKAAEEAGFESAVTTRPGHVTARDAHARFALPRIHIDYCDTIRMVKWKLCGFDRALQALGRGSVVTF